MKSTTFVRLAGLFALILTGIIAGGMVQGIYLKATGLSSSLFSPEGMMTSLNTGQLKIILAIGHVFTFFFPPVLFSYLQNDRGPVRYFGFDTRFHLPAYLWSIFLLFAALPWVQYLQELNQVIDLPQWAQFMEQDAAKYVEQLLTMNTPGELLTTLLIVGVLPAIGEELLFRGCLQKELNRMGSKHMAVWISAILFSAFHLQFAGFLPRLGLGLLLGYVFLWTGTLWTPIFIHFLFNGLQVIIMYFMDTDVLPTEAAPSSGASTWALLLSTFFVFWAGRQLIIRGKPKDFYE